MSVSSYVYMNAGTHRSKGVRASGAGVKVIPDRCWNRTQVLYKSSTGSQLLSQPFSPRATNMIAVISIIRLFSTNKYILI